MADHEPEYDQYAPQTGGRLFSNAMFGFNKEEVLEYLEELADENYQRQQDAEIRIQELTLKVQNLEAGAVSKQDGDAESEATRARYNELTQDLDIAKAATQQAEEDLQEFKEQMYNLQQENNWLREEYQKSDRQIADLRRQLDDASSGQWSDSEQQITELRAQLEEAANEQNTLRQQLEDQEEYGTPARQAAAIIIDEANAEAARIREDACAERDRVHRQIMNSTSGISSSISTLRGDISDVEGDVTGVLEQVQQALASVLGSLGRTEQNLDTMGIQVERFPALSPPVSKNQQQVVYFQPTTEPVNAQQGVKRGAALRAAPPNSYGSGGFRRVWPEDESGRPGAKPFRPTYTNSPAAVAYQPQTSEAYQYELEDENEEKHMRSLSESLVDTIMQIARAGG